MKKSVLLASFSLLVAAAPGFAHYGMIIPNDPIISQEDGRSVSLAISFSHPFEMDGMTLERPVYLSVTHSGETTDLMSSLQDASVMGEQGYRLDYPLERPGTYVFHMEPQPYWEPAEDAF
ncbi:MAG: DUF4198 domain-containing protein, partial [Pseudomonadota bacterium]